MNIKKYTLLAALTLSTAAMAQQITFENASEYTALGVYDTWEMSPFRTGAISAPERYIAVVDNPDTKVNEVVGYAPNPSAKVLAVQRSRFGSNTFGARIDLPEPIKLGNATKYVHAMIKKPEGETTSVMLVALGKRTDWPAQSKEAEQLWVASSSEIVSGVWNDAVFSITTNPNVELHSLVIVPDLSSPHNRTADFVAYVDNIEVTDEATPRFSLSTYPVNFGKEQAYTRSDRRLSAVSVTGSSDGNQSVSLGQATVYRDMTKTNTISAKPGDELTVKLSQSGVWMSGYVYVDWGNDGAFEPKLESNVPAAGSDLVSFTHLDGFNSKGASTNGNNVSGGVITCPSFTIPAETPAGVYRIRFKVDWNSADAGGNTAAGNTLLQNGGGVVDVLLNVHNDEVKISANQLNGDVLNTDETTLASRPIAFGKAHEVVAVPAPGFVCKGLVIKHGYNLDGPQFVKDNMQWQVEEVDASEFKENAYTIPAAFVNGEVRVEGIFDVDITGVSEVSKANADAPIYDLQGRRTAKAEKGNVYIQNRRKFLK